MTNHRPMDSPDGSQRVVTLQAVSVSCGVTLQRVRSLERAGLIESVEISGRRRLYREETIERVLTIERLTNDLGVNLAGAEVILNMREQMIFLLSQSKRSPE